MDKVWAGIDAGKESHYWAHVLDASGRELLSRKVENDEADISKFIDETLFLAEEIVWAVDQPRGSAALLLALLCGSETRGFSTSLASPWIAPVMPTVVSPKTDARDAHVIAYPKRE